MSSGVIALIILFVVIFIGFWRKLNVGLLAISAAVILGLITGISGRVIMQGFSGSLFMTLLGVTFLFGVIQSNGCLDKLMRKSVALCGRRVWIIPILIFVMGWVLAAIGPGCVPALAFVAAVSIPLAHQTGYSPIMLMLIGDVATYSGRFTPITPEGVLVSRLLAAQDYNINLTAMVLNTGIGAIILSIIFFLFYKGYQVKATEKISDETLEKETFTNAQILALVGVLAMISLVIFVKIDVGLASFLVASVLVLFGAGNEKEALKNIPWSTLIMVSGVGVLMSLVISTGGIKMLATAMASIMTPYTAAALTGLTAGCMSWFSSTIGVVLPTLLPTLRYIVDSVGGNISILELTSVVGIVSSTAGFSPASTVGALIMAAHDGDPHFVKTKAPGKLFVELFAWSVFCVAFLCILSLTGIFGIFK